LPVLDVRRTARGFTLVELMIVMVIIGITLGLVSLNAIPSPQQNLQNEAQRLALLLQLARDEAIVRNRLVAFEANGERYRFLVRNETRWDPVVGDDLLGRWCRCGCTLLAPAPAIRCGSPSGASRSTSPSC
jgi:general secretion pathway protein H